jgi:hypothetical protein
MTLVIAATGRESIWMMADRRLTFIDRPPRDEAVKMMFLEARQDIAILGYAGLGKTAHGVEPSDWMSAALRCRKMSLEGYLGVLASAAADQLPVHLNRFPKPSSHFILVPAFVGGIPSLYSIDLSFRPGSKTHEFHYTKHTVTVEANGHVQAPRIAVAGSGAAFLSRDRTPWCRDILRLINANDRKRVPADMVAQGLARINHRVHLNTKDNTVGNNCIVAWRYRKDGIYRGGGTHALFSGLDQVDNTPILPTIADGYDVRALGKLTMQHLMKGFQDNPDKWWESKHKINEDAIKADLAKLPDNPDGRLR